MRVAGIDGFRGGWAMCIVEIRDGVANFGGARLVLAEGLVTMVDKNAVDLALIDMPIGLSSGPNERGVEIATRAFLPGKASSVFNMPCRQALDTGDYAEVNAINRRILGKAISKQSFHLLPKIRETEVALGVVGQTRLREGHPEVSFAVANDNRPVVASKKTARGVFERLGLLEALGFRPAALASDMPAKHPALVDDVLDAMILAWSAYRASNNRHQSFPPDPVRDARGLEMAVWA